MLGRQGILRVLLLLLIHLGHDVLLHQHGLIIFKVLTMAYCHSRACSHSLAWSHRSHSRPHCKEGGWGKKVFKGGGR
jgi:hypothetical protein